MALTDIENLLKTAIGLDAASIGAPAIERAVLERMSSCHLGEADAYWERLRTSGAELQQLIEAVVVPETWFFRDRESLAALGRLASDPGPRADPPATMTLLSVPCSTGEEPYSMAMALLDAGLPAHRFRVDAVDISERALAHARRAVYGRNSFRGQELSFRARHFEATANGYRPSEAVRASVRFQPGNLFAPDFLPGSARYDVIFCRNVLIYFDRATQDRAILVAKRLLKPAGILFVAPAETALPSSHGFVSTRIPLAFAFRNAGAAEAKPRAEVVAPPRLAVRPPLPVVAPRADPVRPAASAVTIPPAPPAADIERAARLADQGHFVEAAVCCEAYLRRHGPSAPALYLMGLVRDATGNETEAAEYYRKTLYLDPNHGDAQVHLAFLKERHGDRDGARILRDRARRLGLQQKVPHA